MLEVISEKQIGLDGVRSGEIRCAGVRFRVRTVNFGTAHFSKRSSERQSSERFR